MTYKDVEELFPGASIYAYDNEDELPTSTFSEDAEVSEFTVVPYKSEKTHVYVTLVTG